MNEWIICTLEIKFFWLLGVWINKSMLCLVNQIQKQNYFFHTILYTLLSLFMLDNASNSKETIATLHSQPFASLCLQWQHEFSKIFRTVTKMVCWWIFRKMSLLISLESSIVTGNYSKHKISCAYIQFINMYVIYLRYLEIALYAFCKKCFHCVKSYATG